MTARGSGRGRALVVEARTGPLAGGGAMALFLAVVLPALTRQDATFWSDRSILAALVCVFTAPVLAAATCLQVSRRISGMGDPAAASISGRGFVGRVGWGAASLWAVLIAATQIISATVVEFPVGQPFTAPMALPWVLCVLVLLAAVALGAVVGSYMEGYGWAAFLALVVFGWLYGTTFLGGKWLVLSPLDNGTVFAPYQEPAVPVLVLHIVGSGAILLVAAAFLARRRLSRVVAGVAAALAVVGCVVAGVGMEPTRVSNQALKQDPVCDRLGGVELCVWPDMADALDSQLSELAAVRGIIAGRWNVPSSFVQDGLPGSIIGTRLFIDYESSKESPIIAAVLAMVPSCSATITGDEAQSTIQSWLFNRLSPGWDGGSESEASVVAGLSEDEQSQWLQTQLSAGSCR